jgi:creatinine amidohydrolase/Fe(II)-dependent formamide hydrolase-like protein
VRPEILEHAAHGPQIASEAHYFDEITANGALGDARLATEDVGRDLVETGLDRYVAYLTGFMNRQPTTRGEI